MRFERASGILLHPTSLPGDLGIGDLGEHAYTFVDFLEECQQKLWQICPLGPTGFGDSPYQCFSAFAGNPLLISLEKLVDEGWLKKWGSRDRPVNFITAGFVAAVSALVNKKPARSFSVKETAGLVCGDEVSAFEAFFK